VDILAFFVYFGSQTMISFEEIKKGRNFSKKKFGILKTRFMKPSDK
jgi:hypothetical protein